MFGFLKKTLITTGLVIMSCGSYQAYAAGTAAWTNVATSMDVAFDVNSVGQTEPLPAQDFRVAQKVDVTVSTAQGVGSEATVTPSATNVFAEFTVQNDGNADQSYTLVATINETQDVFVGAPTTTIYGAGINDTCENGGGDDLNYASATFISLAVDANMKICVYASTAVNNTATVTTGWEAAVELIATTTNDGTADLTSETPGNFDPDAGSAQILFSDADGPGTGDTLYDGEHSAIAIFQVNGATLTVSSTQIVVFDNEAGNCASDATGVLDTDKAIPGACMNFQYTLTNAPGGAQADNIDWTITIPTSELTYVGVSPEADLANTGPSACDHTGGFDITNAGTTGAIVCNINSLAAGASAIVYFRATVN